MPRIDINEKIYDEGTELKLSIFESYVECWLPVFLHSPFEKVFICDFFAGSGSDASGNPGSPLRILQTLEKFKNEILHTKTSVNILFNDADIDKIQNLQSIVAKKFSNIDSDFRGLVTIEYRGEEFLTIFDENEKRFSKQPNLFFIDQYGLKHVGPDNFKRLAALDRTDFMFFTASSFLKRFPEEECFRSTFSDLDPETLKNAKHEEVHCVLLEYYKKHIPIGNKLMIYPFTIKKGPNIYGLIFGTKHVLGVEKFLDIAWKKNPINGFANFDIDKDYDKKQGDLFEEKRKLTKLESFHEDCALFIKDKGEVTNRELMLFAFSRGHTGGHVSKHVKELKRNGLIDCDSQIGFTYNSCYNKPVKTIKAVRH